MKVLWFTNHVLPEHAKALGKSSLPTGGWMPALADAFAENGQVELGIATNVAGEQWSRHNFNNKEYFTIPVPQEGFNYRELPSTLIQDYQRAIDEFKPDIIHIHGTEYFHGLLSGRQHIKCPVIISIQGIISACQKNYLAGMSFKDLIKSRTLRDWIRIDGLIEQKIKWKRRVKWEQEIFAKNDSFIGRTLWDQAHTRRLNPSARYYHCDEIMRHPFYKLEWNLSKIRRHTIFASSASYPLKGFHVLIKAVSILRDEFPDVIIRVPKAAIYPKLSGVKRFVKNCRVGGYVHYLNDLIHQERLEKNIVSLPSLDAQGMAGELEKANVFVLPSMIENSPNSLAEAMLVGTPSVASFVGGVPSIVRDGESALLFPQGDEAALAEQIRRIFLEDQLAHKLSIQARDVALARHSKKKIVEKMLEIYRQKISARNLEDSAILETTEARVP